MNKNGKSIDTTFLSIDNAETRNYFHRDYIAHALRWSHTIRYLYQTCYKIKHHVLDIGCGKEMPLAKSIYTGRIPIISYTGVDVKKNEIPDMLLSLNKFNVNRLTIDAAELHKDQLPGLPTLITCFEVLEHVEFDHASRILKQLYQLMPDDGIFLVSTPCFNGKAAANHVNEMTYLVFGALLEQTGFTIENTYGTFASIKDYLPLLEKKYGQNGLDLFQKMREYHSSDILSNIFAPAFPEASRNCLWHCRRVIPQGKIKFPSLMSIPQPWGNGNYEQLS